MKDLREVKFFLADILRPLIDDAVSEAISKYISIPTSTQGEEKPLNVEQTVDFLGISTQTLYQNVKRIPRVKRFGKLFFLRET